MVNGNATRTHSLPGPAIDNSVSCGVSSHSAVKTREVHAPMSSLVTGVLLILFGLFCIFGKDLRWGVESFRDTLSGKNVQRTELWDLWQNLGGVILIGAGIYLLFGGSLEGLFQEAQRILSSWH